MDRVLCPAAAKRTIRARFKSRCSVTGERQRASSTLRSLRRRRTSLASGIIPTLNHDSPPHLIAQLVMRTTGIEVIFVPFKSAPDALTAVLRGDVQVCVDGPLMFTPHV